MSVNRRMAWPGGGTGWVFPQRSVWMISVVPGGAPTLRSTSPYKVVNEAHAFKGKSPTAPRGTQTEHAEQSVKSRAKYYLRYLGWWIACLGEEEMDDSDALYLTFSAEEVGKIAVMIIQKVERKVAIRSMPRYSSKEHRAFASFYDQLREAMEHGQKEE